MPRPRAAYRNEVKTRLRDEVYERLQLFKKLYYIDSDSAALARIVEMSLCGLIGTLPAHIGEVSALTSQPSPRNVCRTTI